MNPPTWEDTPHLGAASRSGPTPHPGDRPHTQPPPSPTAPLDLVGSSSALATLPEVLTVREAAAILRVGRDQLYQVVARGELGAVRLGRSIRIPKQALLHLLTASPPPATGDE